MLKSLKKVNWSKSEARDGLIAGSLFLLAFIFGSAFDLLENLVRFLAKYEAYELDEIIFALVIATPLLLWFGVRRALEARRELSVTDQLFKQLQLTIKSEPSAAFPLEALKHPGVAIDTDGKILRWNAGAKDLFGYSSQEAVGADVSELSYTENSSAEAAMSMRNVVANQEVVRFRSQCRHKDGSSLELEVSTFPTFNSNGELTGSWVFFEDIADEIERERLLELYREVWEHTDVAVTIVNERGQVIECSPAVTDVFGLKRDSLLGQHASKIIDMMEGDDRTEDIVDSMAKKGAWTGDVSFRLPDGSTKIVEHRVFTLKDDVGKRFGGASISVDISDRAKLERSLKESEETISSIVNYAKLGITFASPDGVFLKVNPAFCAFIGYEASELVGRSYLEFMPKSQVEDIERHRDNVLAGVEKNVSIERQYVRKDGGIVWGRMNPAPVYDSTGNVTSFVTVVDDVTERRAAQLKVQENEARLEQIIDSSGAGLWDMDAQSGRIVFNDKMKTLSGYGDAFPETIEAWETLIHPDDLEIYLPAKKTWTGDVFSFDKTHRFNPVNGREIWVRSRGRFERNAGGQVIRGLGLMWDVTEEVQAEARRHELEEQLAAAQKMEAVGRLTGGIAHDFNNILTIVSGSLQLLPMLDDDPKTSKSTIDRALKACARAASLTTRLLAFSRQQSLVPKVQDIREVIKEIESIQARSGNEQVAFSVDMPPSSVMCNVDGAQLQQAILSLTANAEDAMPVGGNLTITVGCIDHVGESEGHAIDLPKGRCAYIEVSDTGRGMSEEVLQRAIEPFYTDKEVGDGSGLGLSMAYGFMQQSGGALYISSVVNQGTTVTCYLPITQEKAGSKISDQSDAVDALNKSWVILVIEDDVDVRETTNLLLSANGFDVKEAGDARAAVDYLESGAPVDLIFSDVSLPGGMSGVDLANHVYKKNLDVPIVLTTGFAKGGIESGALLSDSVSILSKPYNSGQVISLFEELLSS